MNFIIFHSTTTPYGLDLFYGFFWEMCIDEFLSSFFRAKQERHDLFMKCFDHVSNIIDDIYKALTRNQSAQAFLGK